MPIEASVTTNRKKHRNLHNYNYNNVMCTSYVMYKYYKNQLHRTSMWMPCMVLVQMSTELAPTTIVTNNFKHLRTPCTCRQINISSSFSIDNQLGRPSGELSMNNLSVYQKLLWLARLDSVRYRISCLLHSFAVRSCSYCIDPSPKLQREPFRADWSSGSMECATTVFEVSK